MSENRFSPNDWFSLVSNNTAKKIAIEIDVKEEKNKELLHSPEQLLVPNSDLEKFQFSPLKFLTPGWAGESLRSKEALKIKKIMSLLWPDAEARILQMQEANNALKNSLFQEFVSFAESERLYIKDIEDAQSFWHHLRHPQSPHRAQLKSFLKIIAFRSVVVYLYKIRFLTYLTEALERPITENSLAAPNTALLKIFQKGGANELISEAVLSNQYSWYVPSEKIISLVVSVANDLKKISLSEMMKLCTYRPLYTNHSPQQMFCESEFSHSLSHRTFGLLLHELLISFPSWIEETSSEKNSRYSDLMTWAFQLSGQNLSTKEYQLPQVINCKFVGDHLSSFSQAHWLSQEQLFHQQKTSLIAPDFIGSTFVEGCFTKICHEIQFLTHLAQYAKLHKFPIVDFISKICRTRNVHGNSLADGQTSLFPHVKSDSRYQSIVLNVFNLPKNNPHHYLINEILRQIPSLTSNGRIFLFTNQQLFVPSKSEKVDQLLQQFDVEAFFSFDELKGRGEICSFMYIFKKNTPIEKSLHNFTGHNLAHAIAKKSCLTFKWKGELHSFQRFSGLVHELKEFIINKSPAIPVYQVENDAGIHFEFHQDAIVDGHLLQSLTESHRFTHPNFFRNITKHCLPLDYFFYIELQNTPSIGSNERIGNQSLIHLFGPILEKENYFPFILVLNFCNPQEVTLDVIPSDTYRAKVEELGTAYYQYFGLRPKINNLNINIFKEYFKSEIGRQVAQLSLNGGPTKTKGKVKTILIPKVFSPNGTLSAHSEEKTLFFRQSAQELLATHPSIIQDNFHQTLKHLPVMIEQAPHIVLGDLCFFKTSLENALENYAIQEISGQEFNNPIIVNKLKKLPTFPLYPNNNEVHTELLISRPQDIHLPVISVQKKKNQYTTYLEIHSENKIIAHFYSEGSMINFIKFLIEHALGHPFHFVLQKLVVPKIADLNKILIEKMAIESTLKNLHEETQKCIRQVILQKTTSPPPIS